MCQFKVVFTILRIDFLHYKLKIAQIYTYNAQMHKYVKCLILLNVYKFFTSKINNKSEIKD